MGKIYNMVRDFSTNNNAQVTSVGEIGQAISEALKDGALQRGEMSDFRKIRNEADTLNLTRPARLALDRFLGIERAFQPNAIGAIFGVTPELREKFESAGVMDAIGLLTKLQRSADRSDFASSFGVSIRRLTDVAQRADLARVVGVGEKYAALLEAVGVRNIQDLQDEQVDDLHGKIKTYWEATPAAERPVSRRPSKSALARWINNSATLPYMLFMANEREGGKLPFDVFAFSQLDTSAQAKLLWGADVDLGGGKGIFDADALKTKELSTRRIPASVPDALKSAIRDLRANPPEHPDFQGESHAIDIKALKEVKLGNKTIGYTLSADVQTDSGWHYEGQPIDEYNTFELNLAFDPKGKKIDEDVTYHDHW